MARRVFARTLIPLCALLLVLTHCDDNQSLPTEPTRLNEAPVATSEVFVGAGDIARCDRQNDEATAALLDNIPGTVFTLGDNAYPYGAQKDYLCYDASWGRHKARTMPAPGDYDYKTSNATPYFNYFGTAAGDPLKGYYSYDLGPWHIVVLNTKLSMSAGSAQEQWLKADLKASDKMCTLVIGHYARFYTGSSSGRTGLKPIWKAMYDAGAELYLSSHTRIYERFAPQNQDGVADPYGIRQFIVSTGGISHGYISSTVPKNSEVRDNTSFGVIKFTLHEDAFDWEFIPIAGNTFRDAGSAPCHRGRPPVAHAGGPYLADGTITFDASASSDPGLNTPLSYSWDFGDGSTGDGEKPTHTYAADGSYTVTLVATNTRGASATAVTTVENANIAPVVSAGRDAMVPPDQEYVLNAQFTDPGLADAPWTSTIDWGDGSPPEIFEIQSQSNPITRTHSYGPELREYAVTVSVTDKDGGTGTDALAVTVSNDPPSFLIAAGDIGDCGSTSGDGATAALIDALPGTVAPLGDNAYPDGTVEDFAECYEPGWGRHKLRSRPTPGNHEYHETDAGPYFDYFGELAGEKGKGYYSYDLGAWHIISLNTNIPMTAGSPQELWLREDLAANSRLCTLAYWHHSRFNSTRGIDSRSKGGWQALFEAGADVIISSHEHNYERFAPQRPDALPDPERGIRQFVVGTGGHHSLYPFGTVAANSEVRIANTFGVLKLALYAERYEWEFLPVGGGPALDSGGGSCH